MTRIAAATKIGYTHAFKAVTVGLLIAYAIMALLAGPLWLFEFDYAPTLVLAACVLYGAAYIVGRVAGKLIIIKKYSSVLIGIISGYVIVWIATFFGSMIGFFNEGLNRNLPISESVHDYIFKPLFMVSLWGSIPLVAIGSWYGWSTEKRGKDCPTG